MSVKIDKIVYMAAILALFVLGSNDYKVYVWLYMAAKLCAMIYCVYKGREVVFAGRIPMSTTVKETLDSNKSYDCQYCKQSYSRRRTIYH